MNILLTGATGFLGSNLLARLVSKAAAILGWAPVVSANSGVERMLRWIVDCGIGV